MTNNRYPDTTVPCKPKRPPSRGSFRVFDGDSWRDVERPTRRERFAAKFRTLHEVLDMDRTLHPEDLR